MISPLIWIPLPPLLAFAVLILVGRRLGKASAWVAIGAMGCSMACAWQVWRELLRGEHTAVVWSWMALGERPLLLGLQADPLSGLMLGMVTVVGTLIQIYAVGYMAQDARFSRFFAYLSLFCAAMLGLVLANSLLLFFICWELMGLCSYLLISFWFEKPSAAAAGKKAFITTRIGDAGLLAALLGLYWTTGTLQLDALPHAASQLSTAAATAIALGIFAGTVGKSAQFPLHVWLPDAMEGPTPVSALIHAATMVAAGVYLLVRTFPIFEAAPPALVVVSVVGTTTALGAALVACVAHDIKKVLAYSTISQLGFMVAAVGMAHTTAGMFHLTTHAWFKALLFLGAGSVIHAVHTQDVREMGGLAKVMPWTCVTMGIAVWAIAGIPPLSGFWSKDEILVAAWDGQHPVIATLLILTSGLTAFYMMRMFALTFLGAFRGHGHPHESPAVMTAPLAVLSLGAAGLGLLGSPFAHHWLQRWLSDGHGAHAAPAMNWTLAGLTTAIALVAIAVAGARYRSLSPRLSADVWQRWQPVHRVVSNAYHMDAAYQALLLRPVERLWQGLAWWDQRVIDGAVNLVGRATVVLSYCKAAIDHYVVDGLVNGLAQLIAWCGRHGRRLQTGFVQHYLLIVTMGALALVWCVTRTAAR